MPLSEIGNTKEKAGLRGNKRKRLKTLEKQNNFGEQVFLESKGLQ